MADWMRSRAAFEVLAAVGSNFFRRQPAELRGKLTAAPFRVPTWSGLTALMPNHTPCNLDLSGPAEVGSFLGYRLSEWDHSVHKAAWAETTISSADMAPRLSQLGG